MCRYYNAEELKKYFDIYCSSVVLKILKNLECNCIEFNIDMFRPKVSVIIPIYLAEKTLDRCLSSVCCQTLNDIEIICVNDGSHDRSWGIIKDFMLNDQRIKAIEFSKNKGAAAARNMAISISHGEYLGFIDSDDYVDRDFYFDLYKNSGGGTIDIVKGPNWERILSTGGVVEDTVNDRIRQHRTLFTQYTTAIFKKELISSHKLKFPLGFEISEDPVFAIKAAVLANTINIFDVGAKYHYCRRDNSLNSSTYSYRKIKNYFAFIIVIHKFLCKNKSKINRGDYIAFLIWAINDSFTVPLDASIDPMTIVQFRKRLRCYAIREGYRDLADMSNLLETTTAQNKILNDENIRLKKAICRRFIKSHLQ
jgi:glycosyltransferase involved in cell wall biosynthesis